MDAQAIAALINMLDPNNTLFKGYLTITEA